MNETILLTGATDGIGLETAKRLSARGAKLVLHGRSDERLRAAAAACGGDPTTVRADFSSLAEVRSFVDWIVERSFRNLVLVNNAGVGAFEKGPVRSTTVDGFELRWGVNFLAPFALTEGLVSAGVDLRAIVNVGSIGQHSIDVDDPSLERGYEPWRAYRQSKLALVAWTFDLAERLPGRSVNALHPGNLLATKMVEQAQVAPRGEPGSGADAIVHLVNASIAGEHTGQFFDVTTPARAKDQAYDRAFRVWLRDYAMAATSPSATR